MPLKRKAEQQQQRKGKKKRAGEDDSQEGAQDAAPPKVFLFLMTVKSLLTFTSRETPNVVAVVVAVEVVVAVDEDVAVAVGAVVAAKAPLPSLSKFFYRSFILSFFFLVVLFVVPHQSDFVAWSDSA